MNTDTAALEAGQFPTAEAAHQDAEHKITRGEVSFIVGRLPRSAGPGPRYVWCLADDHRALVAPGAPYEGMVVARVGRTPRIVEAATGPEDSAVQLVQTGVLSDDEGGWWIVVQTTYANGYMEAQQFGETGEDGRPVPFPTEDAAVRKAALASAHYRRTMTEAGVTVVDGPGARAERRAEARERRTPVEPKRGPVIDLDAPAAGLWVPGQ